VVLTEKALGWVGGRTSTIVTSGSTVDAAVTSMGIEDFDTWISEDPLG